MEFKEKIKEFIALLDYDELGEFLELLKYNRLKNNINTQRMILAFEKINLSKAQNEIISSCMP